MPTLVLDQPGHISQHPTTPLPAPRRGEALVRVHRVGVCGTDIHAFGGRQPFFTYPRILGHELGVEIIELGEVDQEEDKAGEDALEIGTRCAVEPYLNCGRCRACQRGKSNCCMHLQVLGVHTDGGMRDQFVVPRHKLHPSSSLSFDQLALVETLGIGAHAVQRSGLGPDDTALVIGAGPIGLSAIQFAVATRARVLAMDIAAARLDFCRQHTAIHDTILATSACEAQSRLHELTDGQGADVVFDATGNSASMQGAFDLVAFGGRIVFIGLFPGAVSFHDPDFHRREITLLASRNALPDDFQRIIVAIESGAIDTRPWITHRTSASDFSTALPNWLHPEAGLIKGMINFAT